jgi:hypothetical protein
VELSSTWLGVLHFNINLELKLYLFLFHFLYYFVNNIELNTFYKQYSCPLVITLVNHYYLKISSFGYFFTPFIIFIQPAIKPNYHPFIFWVYVVGQPYCSHRCFLMMRCENDMFDHERLFGHYDL